MPTLGVLSIKERLEVVSAGEERCDEKCGEGEEAHEM
jgi:hypothetical protein